MTSQQQQQFTRLKVEDALSYLDQVKLQFGNQPHVYNEFLDIMKEFKSQSIDTPGVINRVSTLFRGHPDLIVGFNTFLPPGYKIEVSNNEIINVHQPGQQILSFSTSALGDRSPPQLKPPHPPPVPNNQSGPVGNNGMPPHPHYSPHPGRHNQQPSPQMPFPPQGQQPGQPVEFNHAISYVNKIKHRFQGQPEIYRQFLEILHKYQKEQRNIKDGVVVPGQKPLTEAEVYSQVAKLFQNQEDLLNEFGQFLPDANGSAYAQQNFSNFVSHLPNLPSHPMSSGEPVSNIHSEPPMTKKAPFQQKPAPGPKASHLRRPSGNVGGPPTKKAKATLKDVSLNEAGKYGTLNEYAFFDKVRKAFKNQEVYENFLRCLVLFNQEVVSRNELVQMVQPFLGKFPDLYKWFKDFLGYKESGTIEPIPQGAIKERINSDLAMEIDFSSCKRYGASYRALPKSYPQPKCSGRTQLCKEVLNQLWLSFPTWSEDSPIVTSRKSQFEEHIIRCEDERFEVLNDTWVSFPTWSEDSSFVTSKKNSYEENIFRTEDERFQLDIVLETNAATIRVLEGVQKKLTRMSSDDAARFRLDNCLGGNSEVLHRKSIQRIYGDKAPDIIDGLRKNPVVAVPLVERRLKAKEEEWREAQRNFNKIWREQNEKYYLKSLDHQGINFKQNDIKMIRSKALLNEIETIFDERQEQTNEGQEQNFITSAHMYIQYKEPNVFHDAAGLIIHHVKRQTSLHKDDKRRIKQLLHLFLPDLLFTERGVLSDDEDEQDDNDDNDDSRDDDMKKESTDGDSGVTKRETRQARDLARQAKGKEKASSPTKVKEEPMDAEDSAARETKSDVDDDSYSLMFANNNWYLFLRLHNVMCERLLTIHTQALKIAEEEARCKRERKESTAIALRLKAPSEVEPEQYYGYFLDRVKDLLDGNMEATAYEDTLREMFGIHAYIAFTMDKIVQNIVRQLQHLVSDDVCVQAQDLYIAERKKGACGGPLATAHQRLAVETTYQRAAEQLMHDENCFRFVAFKRSCKLTMELLDTESENSEDLQETERWSNYVANNFLSPDENVSPELRSLLAAKPVFLPRNIRQWRRPNKQEGSPTGGSSADASKDKDSSVDEDKKQTADGAAVDKRLSELEMMDSTECKFNVNSYKMVYVVNSESCLYKRMALRRARQSHKVVSRRLHSRFSKWHTKWTDEHVTKEGSSAINDWLLGKVGGLKDSTTVVKTNNDLGRPPYYTLNRYRVEYLRTESTNQSAP